MLGSCNIEWHKQPVQEELPCDPTGVDITLMCASSASVSLAVSWFWTQNVSQAGINGTEILSEAPYTVSGFVSGFRTLLFEVNEFTVGYYWCEITNAGVDVKPSTIVPVCNNNSLPQCPDPYEAYPHSNHAQCAIENSDYTVSHSGLPIDCSVSLPSSTSKLTAKKSVPTLPVLSTTILQSQTCTNSPSSVPDQPQSSSNSLPWMIAVAGVGVALVIVICMLVFSVIIICKLKRTIALLRTQAQTLGEISGSVRYM